MNERKKIGLDLTNGSVLYGLLVFSIPIVLTNVIQQFYSLVDLMVIGQFVGSTGTAGVSSGGELADLVTPVATAFASAGQIYIAQLVGSRQAERTKKCSGTLITLMLLGGILFMTVALFLSDSILKLINCPEEAFYQARAYMRITAVGMPFTFGYNAVCGILRGMGESRKPLLFVSVAAVINIGLDVLLVAVFQMDAAGTAIATCLSEMGSFLAAFYFMYRNREHFDFELKVSYFRIDRQSAKVIFYQGVPQAIRTTLVRFSLLWVNANINSYGLIAAATNGVGNKIQKFLDVFYTSLNQAASAMVGQNLGAKKQERAAKTVWCTLGCCAVVCVCLTIISLLLPGQVFGVFTRDPEVLLMGVYFMHMLIAHYFFSSIVTAFQSMIIGSGYASMNFMIGILDGVLCKIGLSILFTSVMGMGVYGYFWAIGFSRALPSVICFLFFISGKWKKRKLLTE